MRLLCLLAALRLRFLGPISSPSEARCGSPARGQETSGSHWASGQVAASSGTSRKHPLLLHKPQTKFLPRVTHKKLRAAKQKRAV